MKIYLLKVYHSLQKNNSFSTDFECIKQNDIKEIMKIKTLFRNYVWASDFCKGFSQQNLNKLQKTNKCLKEVLKASKEVFLKLKIYNAYYSR